MSVARTLLAVSVVPVWPVDNGFSLRVIHLLRHLVEEWDVVLAAPAGADALPEGLYAALRAHVPLPLPGSWDLTPPPGDARTIAAAVRAVRAEHAPDAALLWGGAEFLVLKADTFPPTVVDRIDCSTLICWRDLPRTSGRARLSAVRGIAENALHERRVVRRVQATVVVGEDDAALLTRLGGRDTVHVVPNGVALPDLTDVRDEAASATVCFTGVMAYEPNIDAVNWFADAVWPQVRVALPPARFVIAGRMPVAQVWALAGRDGIEIHADVPDMVEVLREAWLAVAPMRSGAGIKNKVLEAWAAARPVVMTGMAANGLRLDAEAATLVADDPDAMARIIVRLLRDREERRRLGAAGRALVAREHGWSDAATRISELLETARAGRPPASLPSPVSLPGS